MHYHHTVRPGVAKNQFHPKYYFLKIAKSIYIYILNLIIFEEDSKKKYQNMSVTLDSVASRSSSPGILYVLNTCGTSFNIFLRFTKLLVIQSNDDINNHTIPFLKALIIS